MMNKLLRFTLLLLLVSTAAASWAQSGRTLKTANLPKPKTALQAVAKPTPLTGLENDGNNNLSVPPAPVMFRSADEELPGYTHYDRQTNGTEPARIHVWPDGNVSGVWAFSAQPDADPAPSYSDRGTAYNRRNDWIQNIQPNARVETVRTGFPNYVVTASGTEFICSHWVPAANTYQIAAYYRQAGQSTWTRNDIPLGNTPNGVLWAKAAADGENIYVMALTTPSAFNGAPYLGVNGHPLFYRSPDGGATWDIVNGVIPGLDNTLLAEGTSDSYVLAARNGVLAVGLFDNWADTKIWKSYDNGNTWDPPYTLVDFPLDKYVTDAGYTLDDIGGLDPDRPNPDDSLAVFTTDGYGALLIDNAGFVHAFAGEMYVIDVSLTDGGTNYYPGVNGLMYWNEYFPDEPMATFTGALDLNGNDTLDIVGTINPVAYGSSISSMPSAAVHTVNDTVYVAYSVMIEGLADNTGSPLRHVWIAKTGDLGENWELVADIHDETNDPILADAQEGAYPYLFKTVGPDNTIHMLYQRDYVAGTNINRTGVQADPADIVYVGLQTVTTSTKQATELLPISLTPNPATNFSRISFDLKQASDVQIEIYNAVGARVQTQQLKAQSGVNFLYLNLSNLANGMYSVRLTAEGAQGAAKLAVQR